MLPDKSRRRRGAFPADVHNIAELTQHLESTSVPASTTFDAHLLDEVDVRLEAVARLLAAGAWANGLSDAECVGAVALVDRARFLMDRAVGR